MTTIEMQVAEEIKMLKGLVAGTEELIDEMIDAEDYEGSAYARAELEQYKADLSRYY